MNKDQFTSLIQSLLKIGGTALAARGFVTDATWQDITGILLAIAGLAWSHFWNGTPGQSSTAPQSQPVPIKPGPVPIILFLPLLIGLCSCLTACKTQPPPAPVEQVLFDIQTNRTPLVITQMQTQVVTNWLPSPVQTVISNVPVWMTNYVPLLITNTQTEIRTQLVEHYTFVPNTNAEAITAAAGGIASGWGYGGYATLGATGLFGLWAFLRSKLGNSAAGQSQSQDQSQSGS